MEELAENIFYNDNLFNRKEIENLLTPLGQAFLMNFALSRHSAC